MISTDKICVIGHKGMLGHAIWDELINWGYENLAGCDLPEVDLCSQEQTETFFEREKPDYVFFLAAVAAGIEYKRKHPADMLLKNLQMVTNVMSSAYRNGCNRLLNVCSALLYPDDVAIPLREEDAIHVDLGKVDTSYALAKAAGMQLARYFNNQYGTDYLTVVPCNFFGAYAPFAGDRAGVVPALILRIHEAKVNRDPEVIVWGTGNACRELLSSRDVASACVNLMETDVEWDLMNIGCGREYSICEIAETVRRVIGFEGRLVFDASKPEGRLHMQLNTERIFSTGWRPAMGLEESVREAYDWYINFG